MPTITIHNVETNEIEVREMNTKELAQWQADQAKAQAQEQAKAEAQAKRQAVLDRLGITEEEARLLLS